MKREIKFRGWSDKLQTWLYGDLFRESLDGDEHCIQYYDYEDGWMNDKVVESTIGQYTGRKDRHGREIYEGDIITGKNAFVASEQLLTVKFVDCLFSFQAEDDLGNFHDFGRLDKVEIIGNIYDKPVLRQEKEK